MRRTRQGIPATDSNSSRGSDPAVEHDTDAARPGSVWVASLGILLLVGAVYSPILLAGFTNWDDDRFFVNNPLFSGPVSAYVLAAFTRVQFQAYHPLHLLSYLPDRLLWPHHPAGFHALNLVLWGLTLVLGFRLLRRHVNLVPALAAVLLVGLSPVAVESVAWAVGRKDILALLLLFAFLLVEDRPGNSPWSTLAAWTLAISAVLVKTSTVLFPVVLFAWLRYARDLSLRPALRRCAPFLLVTVAAATPVPFIWHENQMIPPDRPLPVAMDVLGTIGIYLGRIAAPIHLSPVYPALADGQRVAAYLTGLALLAVVVFWKRLPREVKFAVFGLAGCLLPVANIIPVYFRFADRYALLALGIIAWPCARLISWPRTRKVTYLCVPAALVLQTWLSLSLLPAWHDSVSLWQHAAKAQPRASFAFLKLGETYRSEKRFSDAAGAYIRLGELEPASLKGPAGLLRTLGERAESQGQIPTGTHATWEAALAQPDLDPTRVGLIIDRVDSSGCHACTSAVLWVALRMFHETDTNLVSAAKRELDRGRSDTASIYAMEVRDRGTAGLTEILARLNALQSRSPQ